MTVAVSDVLDPKQAHIVAQWKHDRPLNGVRYDPLARYVVSVSEDAAASRFLLADGTRTVFSGGYQGWGRALAYSSEGRFVITGSTDGNITWWETAAEAPPSEEPPSETPSDKEAVARVTSPVRSIAAHKGWVRCMDSSPDGTLIATGGNDNQVRVWNAETGELKHELSGHESHIYSLLFHPGGEWLLSGELKGVIRQWDLATGQEIRTFDAKKLHTYHGGQRVDYGGVRAMSISPDGKTLAAGGLFEAPNPFAGVNKPLVLLFDWETQEIKQEHVTDAVERGAIWRLEWLADGTIMGVSSGTAGILLFWKPDTPGDYHRFKLPNQSRDMDLHPDGLHVATAHHDGHVRVTRLTAPVKPPEEG